ncbi:hypothetical protein IAI10_19750 [Clostridium sp. 19966]|uniref:hypothetical protein n=1 Tax=Clostridium sp. 19966 TaxID=2768166 RepID=UPI0028DF2BD2|nr:hypothetical protein [Clostridium sp. 19966]MDT8718890.1 hypothetical protein [Clostridium sp. 19966]
MIIEIEEYKRRSSNLRFTHRSVLIGEAGNKDYRVILMLKNIGTGIVVAHPLTEFFSSFNNLEHSSIVKKANTVVPFLNYIFFDNYKIYKLKNISELEFEHGVDFLNYLGKEEIKGKKLDKLTILAAESILKQFYYFLAEKNILNYISLEQFTISKYENDSTGKKEYIKSPFKNVRYPRRKRTNSLKSIPKELILAFIDLAILEVPDIALGIYFQIFGGLRISEVINISSYGIELIGTNGTGGMIINLKRRFFREDILNNSGKGGVKKERYQPIIPILDLLPHLYSIHMKKINKNKNEEALFLNRDGKPMTEKSYRNRFDRLKKKFINCLESNNNPQLKIYSLTIRTKKWSSHIGRGTFSKLVADYTKNPTELAILRGDSSYEAVFTYLQGSFGVKESLNKVMSEFYDNLINLDFKSQKNEF